MFKFFKKKITEFKRKNEGTVRRKQKHINNKNSKNVQPKTNTLFIFIGCFVGLLLFAIFFKYIVSDILFNYDYIQHNSAKMKLFVGEKNYLKNVGNTYITHGNGEMTVKLAENDNLFNALLRNGFDQENVNNVLAMFYKKVDLRTLKAGQKFEVNYNFESTLRQIDVKKTSKDFLPRMKTSVEVRTITKMVFKQANGTKYIVELNDGSYILHIEKPKLIINTHVISGTIQNNLFADVIVNDIRASTLINVLNEYAFLIDFQRDLRRGDKFIFVLETAKDNEGDVVEEKVLYSNLVLSGCDYEVFAFNGKYYDRKGKSIQKNLLRTPVDGARITSGFTSRRKHPILGYTRAHKGIDMAVPTGTPIYSAGDGVVAEIQLYHPAYGKFVLIRHNHEYSTKYAHMSRIGNIRVGQQVKQRQVIGYVGMSGLATGPHLHYEVIRYGKHINPRSVKSVATKQLDAKKMESFKEVIANIDKILGN